MQARPAFLLIVIGLLVAGCAQRKIVQVVDSSGTPIEGAKVEAVSLSINSQPNMTDAKGEAVLPASGALGVQAAKWVAVSKAGYKSVQVDIPAKWPLQVTLTP